MLDILHNAARNRDTTRDIGEANLVNGPHCGYFVAAYAVPTTDGYVGYAKVFRERPVNPWDGLAIAKYAAHGYCSDSALRMAELRALGAIVQWNG